MEWLLAILGGAGATALWAALTRAWRRGRPEPPTPIALPDQLPDAWVRQIGDAIRPPTPLQESDKVTTATRRAARALTTQQREMLQLLHKHYDYGGEGRPTDYVARQVGMPRERVEELIQDALIILREGAQASWSLEHFQNEAYILRNTGNVMAHKVRAEVVPLEQGGPALDWPGEVTSITPGESVKFLADRRHSTRDMTLTVTWTTEPSSSERQTWRGLLPPRPPRAASG